MAFSTHIGRPALGFTLSLSLGLLAACSSKTTDPAPLPGRWNLQSQNISNVDATTGLTMMNYTVNGKAGDYLEITDTKLDEYTDGQLAFTAPYTRNGNTLSMQGTTPRTDLSREIKELSANRLVLNYKLPVIVANQSVKIVATYTR